MSERGPLLRTAFTAMAAVLVIYAGAWFAAASHIGAVLDRQKEIFVDGTPEVGGFPGRFRIAYRGDLQLGPGVTLHVPELSVRSWFVPGLTLSLHAPRGLMLRHARQRQEARLNRIELDMLVPPAFPDPVTGPNVRAWRDRGGEIRVLSFAAGYEDIELSGEGRLTLDAELQPEGKAVLRTDDITAVARRIGRSGPLLQLATRARGTPGAEDQAMLYLEIPLSLSRRTLRAGPLPVASLPPIRWPSGNPPGPPL